MVPPPRVPPADQLERKARADLAAGRWRPARDGFKALCKRDRATFQPLLVEANVGLARSMLDKGLIADARQVLTYLKTIAPPEIIAALESELTAKTVGSSKPGRPSDAVSLLAGETLAPDEQRRMADRLVVEFDSVPMDASTPERAAVLEDLRAIHTGLDAACRGDNDGAADIVRPIKRDSAFAHWRHFVRAIAAFQRGDAAKAEQFFAEVPAESAPGRARAAWLLALGKRVATPAGAEADAVLEAAGALIGERGWGRVLARAESLWRAGKAGASYRAVRDGKKSFPSEGTDLSSALTSFYFNSIFALPEARRADYAETLWEIEEDRRAKSPTELMLIRRTLCLLMTLGAGGGFESAELRTMWEGFLRGYEREHGANPRLASVAWAWLGEVLAGPEGGAHFGRGRSRLIDGLGAIESLKKSIALDPANAEAHLSLVAVYAAAKRQRDRNQLLDLAASRFPNNKQVLIAAGSGHLARRMWGKAIVCFDRALVLDRLDPATPDLLATACLRLAHDQYKKGRAAEGRRLLDRAGELAVELPDNFIRGRWCIRARRFVLETMYGDAALGAAALEEARASNSAPAGAPPSRSASDGRVLFFLRMAWSFYDNFRPFPPKHQAELDVVAKAHPSARDAVALVQIWKYWNTDSRPPIGAVEVWLRRYLQAAARKPFTREDAARLLAVLAPLEAFGEEARGFTSRVLKRDANDPLFRLYHELLEPFPNLDRASHDAILAEARRRGDTAAEQLLREVEGAIGVMGPSPIGPALDDDDFDFDPLEEFDDDADFSPDSDLDPADEAALAELLNLIARTPDSELEKLKKARPREMPASLFDLLVSLARGGPGSFPMPRRGKPRKKKPRPKQPRPKQPPPAKAAPVVTPPRKAPAPAADTAEPIASQQPDLFGP